MKIGIFGGSFNPLHNGHINAALEVLTYTDLEEIWFVPCIKNMLKENKDHIESKQRLEMLRIALSKYPKLKVSDFEIKNEIRYTADTVPALKKEFPQHEFYLVLGSGLAEEFHKWKEPEKILQQIKIIIVPMPNMPNLTDKAIIEHKPIIIEKAKRIDISSTKVRKYVKECKSISELVPSEIEKYITKKRLYL
ncbi:MAG: nicotinate (nicotinamide) nucleotide adenylyltransferase [Candidatus Diapherotrites archaeon]